jgi:hypothetical protein
VRNHACPRCWEVIEQPTYVAADVLSEGAVIEEAAAAAPAPGAEQPYEHYRNYEQPAQSYVAAPTLTQDLPTVAYAPAPVAPVRDRRKLRLGRAIFIGLVAGLLVAGGLIALEAVGPRLRGNEPDQIELVREAFPDLDFAISPPRSWDVRPQRVSGLSAVTFIEPAREGAARRFRMTLDTLPFDTARREADDRDRTSGSSYDEINIIDGVQLDGRKAFRHMYILGDEYRETWWIERGSRTYRLEFWAPLSRREDSAQLYVRIARSLDVL